MDFKSGVRPKAPFSASIKDAQQAGYIDIIVRELVGVVFLRESQDSLHAAALAHHEAEVGVVVCPGARRKGIATYAVRCALEKAFTECSMHRITASVLEPSPRKGSTGRDEVKYWDAAMSFFVGMEFGLELTRRRAARPALGLESEACPLSSSSSWRDVHVLAMLDTEWLLSPEQCVLHEIRTKERGRAVGSLTSASGPAASASTDELQEYQRKTRRTRREEMLARHQHEQEAVSAAEEHRGPQQRRPGARTDTNRKAPSTNYPQLYSTEYL